jgi:LPXTG-motif cell wall-anchored protein
VVWDEVPNLLAWLGIALLVVSGLLILRSERAKMPA